MILFFKDVYLSTIRYSILLRYITVGRWELTLNCSATFAFRKNLHSDYILERAIKRGNGQQIDIIPWFCWKVLVMIIYLVWIIFIENKNAFIGSNTTKKADIAISISSLDTTYVTPLKLKEECMEVRKRMNYIWKIESYGRWQLNAKYIIH